MCIPNSVQRVCGGCVCVCVCGEDVCVCSDGGEGHLRGDTAHIEAGPSQSSVLLHTDSLQVWVDVSECAREQCETLSPNWAALMAAT